MHAGLPKPAQQQQLSVAARNAEALFEAKTVPEIRQIEARTRQDIDDKNLQLRQLVGDSYRDLIDGTDKIIDISTKCCSILDNIVAIQEGCASLAVSVTTTPGSTQNGKENVRRHRELNAVGSRVKYVMDTPEVIWGCLDGQSYLEAACRLLRVEEVHAQLQASFAPIVAAKFPVLSHQWQTVLKFRHHILGGALSALSSQEGLSSTAAADALAAVSLLEGHDSAAALRCFLSARQQWAQQQLEQAAQGAAADPPAVVLATLAQAVQSCVAQVGELFTTWQQPQQAGSAPAAHTSDAALPSNGSSGSSLLQVVLQEDEADVSELYFGSAEGPAGGSSSPEATAWRARNEAFRQQLAPLQQAQVQEACSSWLSEVASCCVSHGLALLQQCPDAASLLQAEAAVHTAMAEWTAAPEPDTTAQQDTAVAAAAAAKSRPSTAGSGAAGAHDDKQRSRLNRLGSAAAAAAVAGGSSTPPGSPAKAGVQRGRSVSDWELTCLAVLGHKVDLWQVLLHAPFLERCKQIIAAALAEACSSIQGPLSSALEAAAQHDPEPAGQLQPGSWPSVNTAAADAASAAAAAGALERAGSLWAAGGPQASLVSSGSWGLGDRRPSLHASGQLKEDLAAAAAAAAGGFRNEVQTLLQLFDRQLHAALQAVLLLTAAPAAQQQQQQGLASTLQPTSNTAYLIRAGSLAPSSLAAAAAAAGPGTPLASAAAAAAAVAVAAAEKQRVSNLQAFAQQQCIQEVQQLAAQLQQQLQQLPAAPSGVQGAPVIEQALILARLCSALAAQSCMLPAVLGPPDSWAAAVQSGPHVGPQGSGNSSSSTLSSSLPASLAQGASALGPAAAALLRMHHPGLAGHQGHGGVSSGPASSASAALLVSLQQELHGIACRGYAAWAAWVSSSFAAEVAAALSADELLFSDGTPLAWTETKLAADGGIGGGDAASAGLLDLLDDAAAAAGDMCFALPACPSAAVLQALSRACWEVRRAGEHTATADALLLLLWELHGALLTSLQQLLHTSSSSSNGNVGRNIGGVAAAGPAHRVLSEKGVLQLLFDQRFVRDVLGGGKPLGAGLSGAGAAGSGVQGVSANGNLGGGGADAAVAARKQLVSGVEQQLQELLDPIDWATYEPHLWSNAQRFYTRSAVLLGVLGQFNKPCGDAPRTAAGAAAVDINALNVLPVVPRFHYLPISTPSTAALPKQRSMQLSSHASAAVTAIARAAGAGAAQAGPSAALGGQQQLPLATVSAAASDLAAQYAITDLGSSSKKSIGDSGHAAGGAAAAAAAAAASFLHPTADTAAAAGASALSALQAKLQGSSFGAFGSMLGDRAAEVTAMAQNFGDLLPSGMPAGLGGGLGGLGGGLLSSFARRDAGSAASAGGGR